MENREMYDEINALIGAVGKALSIPEMEVVTAIEQGRLAMEMITDDEGRNCVQVTLDGGAPARIYQGAIFRPDDRPEETDETSSTGCSCGH
jgi:hypothetical protein